MTEIVHKGGCFCGAVSYEVTGKPILSAYCHCTVCQRHHSSPFIHTIHFSTSGFKWTHEQPHDAVLDTFVARGTKYWCKKCGACVASISHQDGELSVWGAQLERDVQGKLKNWDIVKPTAHIYYDTRMLDVDDQLGKWLGYENKSEKM